MRVRLGRWTPWTWGRTSNEAAIANARGAATALHRARVERLEVEEYVAGVAQRRAEAGRALA